MPRTIWTLGHSNHPMETFLDLLEASSIRLVADVRRFPGSRRHPQFGREALPPPSDRRRLDRPRLDGLGHHRGRQSGAASADRLRPGR
jgi:uncharacterized protein (DUF488 family)